MVLLITRNTYLAITLAKLGKWQQLWQETTDTLNDINDYISTKRKINSA